jgi:hypothetical protein
LVNAGAVSIHHDVSKALFSATAFIFDEERERMVNRRFSFAGNPQLPCSL